MAVHKTAPPWVRLQDLPPLAASPPGVDPPVLINQLGKTTTLRKVVMLLFRSVSATYQQNSKTGNMLCKNSVYSSLS